MSREPNLGNWVSKQLIYTFVAVGVLALLAAVLFLPIFIFALTSFAAALYFAYARYIFSERGGGVENRIRGLVLENLKWDGEGEVLDIGCGNGALALMLASKYAHARVTGVDFWGGNWEYSKSACEENAKVVGMGDKVVFEKASASSLPFADGRFDVAVSNLVFHEVEDTADKKEVIREALRVVKKGGRFSFQDLFLMRRVYGDLDELLNIIKSWGVNQVEFIPTADSEFIPRTLKLPFMVGTIGIIVGEK